MLVHVGELLCLALLVSEGQDGAISNAQSRVLPLLRITGHSVLTDQQTGTISSLGNWCRVHAPNGRNAFHKPLGELSVPDLLASQADTQRPVQPKHHVCNEARHTCCVDVAEHSM